MFHSQKESTKSAFALVITGHSTLFSRLSKAILGEPKNRNAQKFSCSQNVKYLSTKCFKTTSNDEIQVVDNSI